MGAQRKYADLTLVGFRLTDASAKMLKEIAQAHGGTLSTEYTRDLQMKEAGVIDEQHPATCRLTVLLRGMERQTEDSKEDGELAFEVSATMIGTFSLRQGAPISPEEFKDFYDEWVTTQVYLPLREYLSNTLNQMGVRITLPFAMASAEKQGGEAATPVG